MQKAYQDLVGNREIHQTIAESLNKHFCDKNSQRDHLTVEASDKAQNISSTIYNAPNSYHQNFVNNAQFSLGISDEIISDVSEGITDVILSEYFSGGRNFVFYLL